MGEKRHTDLEKLGQKDFEEAKRYNEERQAQADMVEEVHRLGAY